MSGSDDRKRHTERWGPVEGITARWEARTRLRYAGCRAAPSASARFTTTEVTSAMYDDLLAVIRAFQAEVARAVELLVAHLGTSDIAAQRMRVRERGGYLDETHRHRCAFHGRGCVVQLARDRFIDWEYGQGGRTDGFDLWRLEQFLRARRKLHRTLLPGELTDAFGRARGADVIRSLHGDGLFYVAHDVDPSGDARASIAAGEFEGPRSILPEARRARPTQEDHRGRVDISGGDHFSVIDVVVSELPREVPSALVHLRVRDGQQGPWKVMLRCARTGGRWRPSQGWRGGLPHPDPEAHRYVLTLASGSADLQAGDELFVDDQRRALVVVGDEGEPA